MRLVLSIDGGGIRGILPGRLLQAMQEDGCYPLFDMIAGNSTGGIIACGLVSGIPAKTMVSLYTDHGGAVFQSRPLGGVMFPKYSADPLENFLKLTLGTRKLSDATPELLVPSYCVQLAFPWNIDGVPSATASWFFKSWDAKSGKSHDTPLWQVARATSAAPTYLPTANLDLGWFVDGGIFANNPALCAYAAATRLWPGEDIKVLSIGTGAKITALDGKSSAGWGAIAWAQEIASVFMDGAADATTYILETIMGDKLLRCEIQLEGCSDAFDDASAQNIANLDTLAARFAADNLPRIKAFLQDAAP